MTEKEKMLAGQLYIARDKQLINEFKRAKRLTRVYNSTTEEEMERRTEILKELLGSVGKDITIEPPFHCDYGSHVHMGSHIYINYDCIILDVCDITIGDHVFVAPRVGIYAAGHPIDTSVRDENLEFGKPVFIGSHVWIGANTVINPGVTIGNNVVIGSGSVVVKDIPDNVIAVGNPCRVLRPITREDEQYWNQLRELYYTEKNSL